MPVGASMPRRLLFGSGHLTSGTRRGGYSRWVRLSVGGLLVPHGVSRWGIGLPPVVERVADLGQEGFLAVQARHDLLEQGHERLKRRHILSRALGVLLQH